VISGEKTSPDVNDDVSAFGMIGDVSFWLYRAYLGERRVLSVDYSLTSRVERSVVASDRLCEFEVHLW